jgi:lipopolysaccharide/colanic/teichoic acid biosynthesis glycosyltransferase
MKNDHTNSITFKMKNDPRVTWIGRIIRKGSIDELPQLINVLRGEMSLVGPRPSLPKEFEHYEPSQQHRVDALPGLTGYWQVNGKNNTTFKQMIAMDLFYVQNMSIFLDLSIMLKTVPVLAGELANTLKRRAAKVRQAVRRR